MRTLLMVLLFAALLMGCSTHVTSIPESTQTMASWRDARNFQAEGRYELAKQQYQLALATARTPDSQTALQRELQAVDRMLQTLR